MYSEVDDRKQSFVSRIPLFLVILLFLGVGFLIYILIFKPFSIKAIKIEMFTYDTYLLKIDKDLTHEIDDEAIITFDSDGKITAHKEGTATLIFKDKDGNIDKIYKVTVKEDPGGNIQMTKASFKEKKVSLNAGNTILLELQKKPENSDEKLIWISTDETVAIVDSKGNVKALNDGITKITVTGKLSDISAEIEVEVTGGTGSSNKTLKLDKTSATLGIGETLLLIAEISPSGNEKIEWYSIDEEVATVVDGRITAKKIGTTTIGATLKSGLSATAIIEVVAAKIPINNIKLSKTSYEIELDKKVLIDATIEPKNATDKTLIWTSSDESIATVSSSGTVSPKKTGKVIITIETVDGSIKKEVQVSVMNYDATSIKMSSTSVSMVIGTSKKLTYTLSPSFAKENTIKWATSNAGVATVSNGTVKAVGAGRATITATLKNGKSVSIDVTVTQIPVSSISITINSRTMYKGDAYQLAVTINPSNATNKSVTWKSNNNSVVTVSNGYLKAVGVGKATITVTTSNGKSASVVITVIDSEEEATYISTNTDHLYVKVGNSSMINAVANPITATNKTLTWSSYDTSIATVNSSGVVTGKKAGTTTILITANNGKVKKEVKVTVNP